MISTRCVFPFLLAVTASSCGSCELHDKVSGYRDGIAQLASTPDPHWEKAIKAIGDGKWSDVGDQPSCRETVAVKDDWDFGDVSAKKIEGWIDTAGLAILPRAELVKHRLPGHVTQGPRVLELIEGHRGRYSILDEQSLLDRADELGDPKRWDYELLLAVDEASWPRADGPRSFSGGMLVGQAFVYSYAKGRLVCAGPLDVENDKFVKTRSGLDDRAVSLNIDLTVNAVDSAIKGLRALPSLDEE